MKQHNSKSFIPNATVTSPRRFSLRCPSCSTPVLQGTRTRSYTTQERSWLQRLDSTAELWSRLPKEVKDLERFDVDLHLGECRFCEEICYFIEINIAPEDPADDGGNIDCPEYEFRGSEENRIVYWPHPATSKVSQWLMQSSRTPVGRFDCHFIGPIRLDQDESEVDPSLRIIKAIWKDIIFLSESNIGSSSSDEMEHQGAMECL